MHFNRQLTFHYSQPIPNHNLRNPTNRPRSIYQYSNMASRLSGQNCKFFNFLLSSNSQKRLRYKENNTKYRSLTRKPRSHVRILIYRTWPIRADGNSTRLLIKPEIPPPTQARPSSTWIWLTAGLMFRRTWARIQPGTQICFVFVTRYRMNILTFSLLTWNVIERKEL